MISGVCQYVYQGNTAVGCKYIPTIGLLPDSRELRRIGMLSEFPQKFLISLHIMTHRHPSLPGVAGRQYLYYNTVHGKLQGVSQNSHENAILLPSASRQPGGWQGTCIKNPDFVLTFLDGSSIISMSCADRCLHRNLI